jgi:ketosteroid isomerase-like protein
MRRTGLAVLVCLALAPLAFAQAPSKSTAAKGGASAEEELKQIDRKWLDAEKRYDVAYCEKFFSDSYVLVLADGQMLTKKQWLGILGSAADRPTLEVLSPDDIQVHLFGNVAILTDHTTIKGHDSKGNSMDGQYRVFRVVTKENGSWRAAGVVMNKIG